MNLGRLFIVCREEMSIPPSRLRGFTLIEMILVVGIIALLALFAVQRLGGVSQSARHTTAEADLRALRNAFLSEQDGYLHDFSGIPGFSPAYMRIGNLFVATNVFGTAVGSGGGRPRAVRLDIGGETEASCAAQRRALPSTFTTWDATRGRGWRGPYIAQGSTGFFPAKDDRRFPDDATFSARNFFPDLADLRLPAEFKDSQKASAYGFVGEPTLFDPWGNPYVLQVPPPQAFTNVTTVADETRFGYARLVSAGPDGVLDTPCFYPNATNMTGTTWNERARRLARQAGLIDGTNCVARGDDIVLFLTRSDVDEGEEGGR